MEEDQLKAAGFERVHVELARHNGPYKGLADVGGVVHYFDRTRGWEDTYFVWPASETAVEWEREQWAIFVRWNASEAGLDTHPGHGGVDQRYDELDEFLEPYRQVPAEARTLLAEWEFDDGERYRLDGIDQWVRWTQP